MKKAITLYLISLVLGSTFAQDPHFSQFYNSQLTLNPALTGTSIGNIRLTANYRNQWASVSKFQTTAFAADMSVMDQETSNFGGVGFYLVNDQSGETGFNTNKLFTSFAYHNAISKNGYLAGGLQIGVFSTSFSSSAITTDNMWTSGGVDESLGSGESFSNESITRLDLNAGLLYYHFLGDKGMAFGGLSLFHLSEPNNSFTGEESSLPRRYLFHGGVKYAISQTINLFPKLIFMSQGAATELNLGTSFEYDISDSIYKIFAIGAWYRSKDAFIVMASVEYSNIKLGLSYDINTSGLKDVTNLQGGFEVSATYVIAKPNKRSTNLSTHNPRY